MFTKSFNTLVKLSLIEFTVALLSPAVEQSANVGEGAAHRSDYYVKKTTVAINQFGNTFC